MAAHGVYLGVEVHHECQLRGRCPQGPAQEAMQVVATLDSQAAAGDSIDHVGHGMRAISPPDERMRLYE